MPMHAESLQKIPKVVGEMRDFVSDETLCSATRIPNVTGKEGTERPKFASRA
jgi:hypothetical protein